MMIRTALAALALAGLAQTAQAAAPADPERAAILAKVDAFFTAMRNQDAKGLADAQFTDGVFTIQRQAPDGHFDLQRPAVEGVLASMALKPGLDEHIWDPTLLRRGPMAVVWAPYEFKLDGKTSHCGIDVFNLVQAAGQWKIASVMWTAEPKACPELGAKPVAAKP
ncbi:hypothetical protein [Phenylobacterium aquaticum]|uniref:hypothetical protein n=1 Tax=Phenylobacterium aquaticum TaxID=1763816 RepID=UPI0026F14BEC|nr:hypothetical protein [Phenylobacterium aquaticum]